MFRNSWVRIVISIVLIALFLMVLALYQGRSVPVPPATLVAAQPTNTPAPTKALTKALTPAPTATLRPTIELIELNPPAKVATVVPTVKVEATFTPIVLRVEPTATTIPTEENIPQPGVVEAAELGLVSPQVLQSLAALGYSSFDWFTQDWGLKLAQDNAQPVAGEIDPREVTTCPFEVTCVRIIREKDAQDNILPFWISSPVDCWEDGYRQNPGVLRPGGYSRPEKSGIPPKFSGLAEGVTIRLCPAMAVVSTVAPREQKDEIIVPTKIPTVAPTTVPASSGWTEKEVRKNFQLGDNAKLTQQGGDWLLASSDGKPVQMTNTMECWMDGYRDAPGQMRPGATDPKVGVPPGFTGLVGGATLRPCSP